MSNLLAALSHSGVDILYSSELIPLQLTINAEPRPGNLMAQTVEVLTANGLGLNELSPARFVITRRSAPRLLEGSRVPASPERQPRSATTVRLPEVAIYGSRFAFDRYGFALPSALSRRYLAQAPGARNDVLRAAQTLPGIATGTSSRPYIRGSVPEDVLVVFDHVAIADPFHLKRFQRLISVFDSSVVDRMDVYSGAYPVRYGTRSGGVVDLTPRSLAHGHEHGLDLGLQSVAISTVGQADSRPLQWLFAVRGNVVDLLRKPASSGVRQSNLLDLVGRVRWQPNDATTWIVGTLLMDDRIRLHNRFRDELATTHSRDERSWLALERQPDGPWHSRTILGIGREQQLYFGSIVRAPAIVGGLEESRDFRSLSLGTEWTYQQDGNARWNFGADLSDMHGNNVYVRALQYSVLMASSFGREANDVLNRMVNTRQISESAFVAFRPQLQTRLETELGLRFDAQQVSGQSPQTQWSPRLNARYHLTPRLDVYGSWGKFTQAQRPDEWRLEEGQARADTAQTVTEGVIGVAHNMLEVTQWRVELYSKHWNPVSPYFDNLLDSQNLVANLYPDRVRVAPLSSDAFGAEFSARQVLRSHLELRGNLSLARVTDSIQGLRVARSWDQRWSANAGLAWTTSRLTVLGTVRSHAGWPRTPVSGYGQVTQNGDALQVRPRNTARWDSFVSADLRAAWTRPLPSGSLEFWAELTNSGNRDNKCCLRLRNVVSGGAMRADTISWQPRSLDLGISWRRH